MCFSPRWYILVSVTCDWIKKSIHSSLENLNLQKIFQWSASLPILFLLIKLWTHRAPSGSGKVPLECIVTLRNRSHTHSQALTLASKLQSCRLVCLYPKHFVCQCLGSYFEVVDPISEVSVVPFRRWRQYGQVKSVADPGFSRGGGAWTLQGGREHAKFSRKLHEIERIWTPRGGRASLTPPPDPPMEI